MNEKLIHLQADDDILTVRGRLEEFKPRHSRPVANRRPSGPSRSTMPKLKSERAILVVPKGCKALRGPVGLDLLARWAEDQAVEVALVTKDRAIKVLAWRRGFTVFPSVERASGEQGCRGAEVHGGWGAPPLPHSPAPRLPRRRGDWISVALLFGCVFLLLAAGLLLIVPSAEVTLVPISKPLEASIDLRANPDAEKIDLAAGTIPARVVEAWVEGVGQNPTVFKKDVPDEQAKGTVVFTNKTGEAVEVPEGTVVSTSAGTRIRFIALHDITVPAGGRARAEVKAVDPGPVGNVGAFLINAVEGSLALKVRVVNGEPTSGGSVKRVGTVTEVDKEGLKTSLLKKLHQEAQTRLEGKLEESEFIPPASIEVVVIDEIYDKFVDEVADALRLKIRAIARGMAIDRADAKALARSELEKTSIGQFQLMPESLEIRIGEVKKVEGGDIEFIMEASGIAAARIDEESVAGLIRGLTVKEAKARLDNLPLQGSPIVKVSPPWLGRVPWLPFRIHISVGTREA